MRFKFKRLHWLLAAAGVAAVVLPWGRVRPRATSRSAWRRPRRSSARRATTFSSARVTTTSSSGSAATTRIDGLDGIDLICGNEGTDDIDGGPGIDGLLGGPGDDRLDGSESTDLFGEDRDFAFYSDVPAAVQASLTTGVATGDGTDTLVNLEAVVGTTFGDTLEGDSSWNYIDGGPGDDSIVAGAGDDTLDGDDGNDALDGGPGNDWVSYHYAPAPVNVDLGKGVASGWGSDTITGVEGLSGSRFADRLVGDDRGNRIESGGGG